MQIGPMPLGFLDPGGQLMIQLGVWGGGVLPFHLLQPLPPCVSDVIEALPSVYALRHFQIHHLT